MKLKIYCAIISFLLAVTLCNAQSDSLATVSDSLLFNQAHLDSLGMQTPIDSLDEASTEIDYSDYLNLFERVEKYKSESRDSFRSDPNKRLFWSIQGHLFGLSTDNYFIRKDNFTELNSLSPNYLKLQHYNRFYRETLSGDFYHLDKEYYDLPVTAIEVVASTGDYDLGTGYVALKKNKFFDRYNLDFRMNFVKADFYNGSELASNTTGNLIIPFKNSYLDIAFNSVSFEGPYYRLSPAFRLNSTIFEENSQSFSAFYNSNLLKFGLKYSAENYQRITPRTLKREYFQILLNKDFNARNWHGEINYEYFFHQEDFYSQELNSLSSDLDQVLDLYLSSDYDHLNLSNRIVLTYPYQLLTNSELSYTLTENWKFGVFSHFRQTLKKENLFPDFTSDTDDNPISTPFYLNEKNNTGLNLHFSSSHINLEAAISNANIETELLNSPFAKDYQAIKTHFAGDIFYSLGKYAFKLSSLMRFYQDYDNYDIHYLPKAMLTNSLEISRDVNHNNFIKTGLAHHYFDAYLAWENSAEVLYPQSSLLDIYLGFQITKLFEINAYWKNILDNQIITGHRTIPQSITVLISWNFLN